ncbi:MAG: NAD(P)-dependent oxidoreductase [Acidobacteriota bacterium]|nr:NAD(P)-dependent oxidoreductase [Acidobacteriota bacterium]
MRALITGATGFVGSYLTRLLVNRREAVAVLRRPESNPWRINDVLYEVIQIKGDLIELSGVRQEILDFAPDTVFHLGWDGVGNRHRNDEDQVKLNLYGSLDLLRLGKDAGCQVFVGLGSQAEYGPQLQALDEKAPTNPTTLYGAVKLCTYVLARQLSSEWGLRFAWLRLFSSYGPKDNPNWMIPYLIGALQRGERPALTGGEQRWDYVYVEDVAEAIYLAALTETAEGVFNLGSGQAYPLRSIVEQIRDLIDVTLPLGFGEVPYRPDQVMHLLADVAKLRTATGWQPRTELSDGLRQTVEWYLSRTGVSS